MSTFSWLAVKTALSGLFCGAIWLFLQMSTFGTPSIPFTPELTRFPFDIQEIDEVILQTKEESNTLQRTENRWRVLLENEKSFAETKNVNTFLEHLAFLPLQPLANPGPEELYGVNKPEFMITLKSKGREIATLQVGSRVITEDGYYIKRAPFAGIFVAKKQNILPLQVFRKNLRDDRLVPLEEEDILSITFHSEENSFTLRKTEDSFVLETETEEFLALPDIGNSLFATLGAIRVLAFSPAPKSDLSESKQRIEIQAKQGSVEIILLPTRSGFLAKRNVLLGEKQEENLVRLAESFRDYLLPSLDDLRDKRILPFDETIPVSRMKIRWENSFVILEKTRQQDWKQIAPNSADLSETQVESFLAALFRIQKTPIDLQKETPMIDKNSPYGEIQLFDSSWQSIAHIFFSEPLADGSVYLLVDEEFAWLSFDKFSLLNLSTWVSGF